jgi:hypothetical protein
MWLRHGNTVTTAHPHAIQDVAPIVKYTTDTDCCVLHMRNRHTTYLNLNPLLNKQPEQHTQKKNSSAR